MSTQRKSLWWRVEKGKWHEDPQTDAEGILLSAEEVDEVASGDWWFESYCGMWMNQIYSANQSDVSVRRSAPPVADQCAKCRAAKARARKEETS